MAEHRETHPAWYTDLVAAIDAGEATYVVCEECGEAELPPRRNCPVCGSTTIVEKPLPEIGEVATFTEIAVSIEKFAGETPYTVAIVEFEDGLRVTGQVREAESTAIGDAVRIGVERRDQRMDIVTFRPA